MLNHLDPASALATVIYTHSLKPGQAVVLSPPDGGPAVAMLVSLFSAALQCAGPYAQPRRGRALGTGVDGVARDDGGRLRPVLFPDQPAILSIGTD